MQNGLHEFLPSLLSFSLEDEFQIVCSRKRELEPNKKRIFWCHDTASDPESQFLANGGHADFDKMVFVSNWQFLEYKNLYNLPVEKCEVIHNAIVPALPEIIDQRDYSGKLKLIYHSTPHRGLNILYSAFDALSRDFPGELELNVYSSFSLYGWPERDEKFEPLFDLLRNHEDINYNGTVSNSVIRKALAYDSHIFAYPSIWPETSCLCLIESMSAGLSCVHPNLAALPETSKGLTSQYIYSNDINQHAKFAYSALKSEIEKLRTRDTEEIKKDAKTIQSAANLAHSWSNILPKWKTMMEKLLLVKKD